MIGKPSALQCIYIKAIGSVALGVCDRDGKRQKSDLIISVAPWDRAGKIGRPLISAFWYASARHAERARKVALPVYLDGFDTAEIASFIHRRIGIRPIPHATILAMADASISEIDKAFAAPEMASRMREVKREYRRKRLECWANNTPAETYEDHIIGLKASALRRALSGSK